MIKTEKQQVFHSKMLRDARNILEKHGVNAILTGSALLGAYRDGDMCPDCPGAVLTTFHSEIHPKSDLIAADLKKAGFKIGKHWRGRNYKIKIKKKELNIEILGYSLDGNYYYRQLKNKRKVIPKKLLRQPFGKIKLRGVWYKTPYNIEKYLRFTYKNWKVKMTGTPSSYKSDKHMVIDR